MSPFELIDINVHVFTLYGSTYPDRSGNANVAHGNGVVRPNFSQLIIFHDNNYSKKYQRNKYYPYCNTRYLLSFMIKNQ